MKWTEYRGWLIGGHHQLAWPPYLDYVGYGKREERDKVFMFNVEGRTLDEALERVRAEVDRRAGL